MALCTCGKKMSRFASRCRTCHKRVELVAARAFVRARDAGTCPRCGALLAVNASLAGTAWLQCLTGARTPTPCGWQTLASMDALDALRRDATQATVRR